MKNVTFYQFLHTKDREDQLMKLTMNRPHEWEIIQVREEPIQLLMLFPWEITEILVPSDLAGQPGLVLSSEQVQNHILKYWEAERVARVMLQNETIPIKIHDIDTQTNHEVLFRKHINSDNFCFHGSSWVRNFVSRRNLRVGMKIGLCWDIESFALRFSVLNNPPT
ncbi:hypothetical protein M9H77_27331 [Catharanthus roseus]|uniref:Uncharacterized protein n=1 Tax=Catharanthus roseus TaxID=4058 RepID=A0ACC0AGG3_CATRO|nr:hypothetical protein M9H77_27331 [Catharanthus roseus]